MYWLLNSGQTAKCALTVVVVVVAVVDVDVDLQSKAVRLISFVAA